MARKHTLWSISTTIREAERILGFLKTAKEIEGQEWFSGSRAQKLFQILLVKNREYLNNTDYTQTQTHNKLNEEQCRILDDKNIDMSFEMAESIISAKNYQGGAAMRGRQSMSPLVKLGLVYYEYMPNTRHKVVRISNIGNQLLNQEISFEDYLLETLLKYQYPNPSESGFRDWNTKPFINMLRLIKEVNKLCKEQKRKVIGISTIECGTFALSLKSYQDIPNVAKELLLFRDDLSQCPEEERKQFIDNYRSSYLSDFNNPIENCREFADNNIRYMRITKYIYIRGKYDHTYIDLEPRRSIEIDSILQSDNGQAKPYTLDDWNHYMGNYGTYTLPFETISSLTDIALKNQYRDQAHSEPYRLSYLYYHHTNQR